MSKGVHFVELCCGSAALTWSLFGSQKLKTPVSYAGSKTGYADCILRHVGIKDRPIVSITLNDPGTWGKIWPSVVTSPKLVSSHMSQLASSDQDPKALFESLPTMIKETDDPAQAAALRLCKIAGTYGSKEKGGFKGKHKLRQNVDGYIPNRNTIASRLLEYERLPKGIAWNFSSLSADVVPIPTNENEQVVVYIDPPYVGSESVYENTISRDDILRTAVKWANNGAIVVISEAVPLDNDPILLLDGGWKSIDISTERKGQNRKNSKSVHEYITIKGCQ